MTDPDPATPVLPSPVTPPPVTPPPVTPPPPFPADRPERARVEPVAAKTSALPVLYVLGLVVLLAAGYYLWRNPPGGHAGEDMVSKIDALTSRTAALEQRPIVDLAGVQKQLAALEVRLAAVEQRPVPAPFDPTPLAARIDGAATDLAGRLAALDKRLAGAEQGVAQADGKIGQVGATIDTAITTKLAATEAATATRLSQLGTQLGAQVDAKVGALTDTSRKLAVVQAAGAALESGQKLGPIAGAPPALARFADVAPPTEFALKQSFEPAAKAAAKASVPDTGGGQSFMERLLSRAQQSVSVREGDRVLVGDPVTGVLARARRALDGNDLPAALAVLQGLSGPPRTAMDGWIGQAQSLLDARMALSQMARG